MRLFLMQGVPSSMGMMDWGILGWQGPGLWLMELVCLVMICLVMICLVMICLVMICLVMICLVMICLVMICLVMICLGMTCLWMCPMRLFLLAGIWRGMFMLIRRWVLVLV